MFFLFVPDRPLPPRNIVISDIKADSCYLMWDAPEDNGGSEITNYIVEKRDAGKKKSDFELITFNLIDRRFGVRQHIKSCVFAVFVCVYYNKTLSTLKNLCYRPIITQFQGASVSNSTCLSLSVPPGVQTERQRHVPVQDQSPEQVWCQ